MPRVPQRVTPEEKLEKKQKYAESHRQVDSKSFSPSAIWSAVTGNTSDAQMSSGKEENPHYQQSVTRNEPIVTSQDFSDQYTIDSEMTSSKKPKKASYSEIAPKDIDTIGRELSSLTSLKDSYEHLIHASSAVVEKIDTKVRGQLYKGEYENAKISISMYSKNLEDVKRQILEVEAKYQKMKTGADAQNPNNMETESLQDDLINQIFLINESQGKFVLPFEANDASPLAMLSQSLLKLLNATLAKPPSNIRFRTLEKKDYDAKIMATLDVYVETLYRLLTGYFIDGKISSDDQHDFLDMVSRKILTDLRLDNFSRKRQKMEKKNFYIYLCLPKMNDIKEGNSQIIVDRIFAYFSRVLDNLNEQQRFFVYETIRKQKKIRFTSLSKEEIRSVLFVESLRTYRKFILQSEWTTVLNVFSPEKDISLENRIVSAISARDLKIIDEREKHNSFYRKNNIEVIIRFLDVRAKELKGLFPPAPKNRKKEGQPPLLEDVLKDSKLLPQDMIYRLDPLGLIFARFGFNSVRSPIKTNVLWNPQNESYTLYDKDVQKLYFVFHGSLTDSERRRSSVNSLQEFTDLLSNSLPMAQRVTADMLLRTKSPDR